MTCPACNRKRGIKEIEWNLIYECPKCGAVFGTCYLGDSYKYVLPFFVDQEPDPETVRYFDFTCVGAEGITRRHGWFDPATKRIVQVG